MNKIKLEKFITETRKELSSKEKAKKYILIGLIIVLDTRDKFLKH